MVLSPTQVEDFHKNGILVVEDFLEQKDVQAMKKEILDLVDEMDPNEHRGVFSTTSHNQVWLFYLENNIMSGLHVIIILIG